MLSDDKIIELIHVKTNAYLSMANYFTLRQHCLDQQALSVILEQIQNDIAQLVYDEKNEYLTTQIQIACTKQAQQDLDEDRRDIEEAEVEKHQCTILEKEFASINEKLVFARQEKSKQKEILSNLRPLIDSLERQICLQETLHEHTHSEDGRKKITHEHGQQHTSHEHSHLEHSSQNTHHAHSQHTSSYNELIALISPVPAEAQSQLIVQKEQMKVKYRAAQKKLEACLETIEKYAQRQCELRIKLTSEIPQKQQARRERANTRLLRALARSNHAPIHAQLSAQNYSLFAEMIRKFNALKDYQGKQAVTKAQKFSYREYIYCLINGLQAHRTTSLNFYEWTALTQIAKHMQESILVADKEQLTLSMLKNEQQVKRDLDNILSDKEEELLSLQRANPMLTNQNSRFDEDNKRLTQTISERLQNRNQLLTIGAGILLLTLITALLAFIGGMELIFFIPSALCATATLGLFVTSLIYTAQNSSERHQLKKNQVSIEENSKKISTQTGQISTLEITTIPELRRQINQVHLKIEKLKQELEDLNKTRLLFISKANKVVLNKTEQIYPSVGTSTTNNPDDTPFYDLYPSNFDTEDDTSPRL
ncbi:hypothetical protein J2N86_09465 [Legionella lytica]|uniref:Substrate of the Dot/Icm secretion system n=1 Tax=Legionella lytica TaxID=96232 RepID=A0ABY4Y627_9GAMM|nr:hypothetical protein [Legionella lytica]USQ12932.1 hypothetical protein J2N86_09465 [Legionella lytica]